MVSLAKIPSDSRLSPVGHDKALLGAVAPWDLHEPANQVPMPQAPGEAVAGDGSPGAQCWRLEDICRCPPQRGQL